MSDRPSFDGGLRRQARCPGPCDTSHPAALAFHEGLGEEQLRRWAWRSNLHALPRRISLYVHVPYCFGPCFYCGGGSEPGRDRARGGRYVEHVLQELRLTAPLFDTRREVTQLRLGGGAANFLDPPELSRLLAALQRSFRLSQATERDFSIELDPRHVRTGDVAALGQLGFNRVSLGVHDFDEPVQRAIDRVHSLAETLAVIDGCRREGLRSVNLDLIYGLPLQTIDGFSRTLDKVIAARPERVAIHGYAHAPIPAGARHQAARLPGPEGRLELLSLALGRLSAAGYRHVGPDQFALPDDDLVRAAASGHLDHSFVGLLTHAKTDLIGLGPGAISHIGRSITQNHGEIAEWEAALRENHIPVARGLELEEDELPRVAPEPACEAALA